MQDSQLSRRRPLRRRLSILSASIASAALATIATLPIASPPASASSSASTGTVISMIHGPFGPMLVDGSAGPFKDTALYAITADYPGHIGCTTKVVTVVGSPTSCTGSLSSPTTEWPALLTNGAPVAGTGVSKSKLGEVSRSGLGEQVTYNGHPLYLFDEIPGVPTGEEWDEATIPPWHGLWFLVTPGGAFLPWTPTITTTTIGGKTVLATYQVSAGGIVLYPVYSYANGVACTAKCSTRWQPVRTQGTPSVSGGLSESNIGSVKRSDGYTQVTYKGKPLYLYTYEGIAPGPNGYVATGSGNGVRAPTPFTGHFHFVLP